MGGEGQDRRDTSAQRAGTSPDSDGDLNVGNQLPGDLNRVFYAQG
jgi:hypothetical protein